MRSSFRFQFPVMGWLLLACFAPPLDANEEDSIFRLKKDMKQLKNDVFQLKSAFVSLESFQKKTAEELTHFENQFQTQFHKVVLPLLHWPSFSSIQGVFSWVEYQHIKVVQEHLRNVLLKEPLKLMAERDLQLKRAADLKKEIAEHLQMLNSKEAFFQMQLEELKLLERKFEKSKIE